MAFTWKRPEGRLHSPEDMMRVIIRVADDLDMPDKRGACVICGMTMRQEADFWIPGNNADPCFAANPGGFRHDSMGNDGRSTGPLQQQTSGPPPAKQWGWGGLYGDPEGTRKRMDPYESVKLFMAALKRRPYRATNAIEAGDWAQDVQQSGVPEAYNDDWQFVNDLYNRVTGTPATPPPPPPETYGMPPGSNSGGYGGNGVRFPDWVYALGNAFGVLPSTYPGHQESDRNEAGYAPNPRHLNRAIDWAAPGRPDEVDRLTRFADYLATIPQHLEQVIWQNPKTMRSIEVAGGRHQPGYFRDDLAGHRDHVHTRQSKPIPLPGGGVPLPVPVAVGRPAFEERNMFTTVGRDKRTRPAMNFFIHTEEGNSTAEQLARYCQGQNGVSYHYTLRDGVLYNVVDTDYYSWSVLQANVFSINLCFAGSKAGWSRTEWLKRERDIEIAAFIAVQDCRKYGMSVEVLVPRWDQQGGEVYAGSPRSGISDHNYVTRELGIGNHTDVGRQFPWDVFVKYVNKYANTAVTPGVGEDDMSAEDVARLEFKIDRILREQTQKHPSRSAVRDPGEGLIDTWAGMDLNTDGNVDLLATFVRALLNYPPAIARLERVKASAEPGRSPDDALVAAQMLVTAQRVRALLAGGSPATPAARSANEDTWQITPAGPNAEQIAQAVLAVMPAPNVDALEIKKLRDENAYLRIQLADAKQKAADQTVLPAVAAVAVQNGRPSVGQDVSAVVDSVTTFTRHALEMDTVEQAALNTAIDTVAQALPQKTNRSTK